MTILELLTNNGYEDCNIIYYNDRALDKAVIGITENLRLIYDYNKMVEGLVSAYGMDYVDAIEYIDFNIAGAYVDDKQPIISYSLFEDN